MRRLGTKVATFVMAAALVGGAVPTVAFAAGNLNDPIEDVGQVTDAEGEPVFLDSTEDHYYGWTLGEIEVSDEYSLNSEVKISCKVLYTEYDASGEIVEATDGYTYKFSQSGWTMEEELYFGDELISTGGGRVSVTLTETGMYTFVAKLYNTDNELVDEKSVAFYVVDGDVEYCLTLEAETTEVHTGDTVSVKAHITRNGEDVTDLAAAAHPLAITWETLWDDEYDEYISLMDLTDARDDAVFSGADYYFNIGDTEVSTAFGLDCTTSESWSYQWAVSQQTDSIEVMFPEPGIYYVSARCDFYAKGDWDGVLDSMDDITLGGKPEDTGVAGTPGWDVIRFVVTDAEEAVVPEETVSPDDSVPTADVNTTILWILALLSGMVAIVAARKRIVE